MKNNPLKHLQFLLLVCIICVGLVILVGCGDDDDSNNGGGETPTSETSTWYKDSDGDGYGDPDDSVQAETQPEGYVDNDDDGNDDDPTTHPGAAEICDDNKDNDQDGAVDCLDSDCPACQTCSDNDADGYFAEAGCGTEIDCNDNDATIYPGATEVCDDNKDNDCDAAVDCLDSDCPVCRTCSDNDADGYFAEAGCETEIDCDDYDPTIHPAATEICGDNQDNDCDAAIDCLDSDCPVSETCTDEDDDGYFAEPGCCSEVDCDDSDPDINPGVTEIPGDGKDNDCDGLVDNIKWSKTFGGANSDSGANVRQTADGGFIVTGSTYSYGSGDSDLWLIKTDENGTEVWNKTFGGSGFDYGASIQQTADEGFIITGFTVTDGSDDYDLWLIKTDANGNNIWDKTFGGDGFDAGYGVQQTLDGGFIVTGYTDSYGAGSFDLWLIKTDENGNVEWDKTYGGAGFESGVSIQQTADEGFIITGFTDSYGAGRWDVWLVKTDSAGDEQWKKTFGGNKKDYGVSVRETTDSGFIITGFTESYGVGGWDIWLIKTDANGTETWNKTFGSGDFNDLGNSVQQTADGGFIVTGAIGSDKSKDSDLWLIKTDSNGNVVWNRTFGESGFNDQGYSVQQTTDGGFIITGFTESYGAGDTDLWLIKTDPNGIAQ